MLLQIIIVIAFGGLCFGCGYLAGFIVTRNKWRDEMIERGVARYNWQTGKMGMGRTAKRILNVAVPPPAAAKPCLLVATARLGRIPDDPHTVTPLYRGRDKIPAWTE